MVIIKLDDNYVWLHPPKTYERQEGEVRRAYFITDMFNFEL